MTNQGVRCKKSAMLLGTAIVASMGLAGTASAQQTGASSATAASQPEAEQTTLQDIVVTAQKRQQNQQDVPISLTAVTADSLQANRITSVTDLGTAVPNLASRPTGGGAESPAFTMRGVTSYGVVPGSDKELSIYIDGVYIASTVGSALDLPEVAQIEVLRGPQGTLFGRNATVGAISVITRDPPIVFGAEQVFSVGNYDQFRSKTRIDTGAIGDFSATVSYVHDQRRGDIRNTGAGTTFTNPAGTGLPATEVSPQYLGDKDLNSVFFALKYEPGNNFSLTNKFDWTGNHYTPQGASVVGVFADPSAFGAKPGDTPATNPSAFGAAGFLNLVLATQNTAPMYNTTGQRPDSTNNSFTLPGYARDWGDSLTATYTANSNLSFKNVFAYRSSYVRASSQLDGFGGLTVTPALASFIPAFAPIVGSPFGVFSIEQVTTSQQFSNEAQANYTSKLLTLTVGALYFHVKGASGGAPGEPNDIILSAVPFGDLGLSGAPSRAFYSNQSLAAYGQAEVHVTSQIDLVGGLRVTNDKKSGSFVNATGTVVNTPYNDTRLSYSGGANYKPTSDILVYAKYSNAFVAGGFSGPINYLPEVASSWEAGIKSDYFSHRLRANLAVFDVKYTDLQTAQAGTTLGHPEVGLAVADLGDERAKGFELETTALPLKGVTIGAAAGYTDVKFLRLNPIISLLGTPATLDDFRPTLQPHWTVNLSGEYDTPVLFGDSRMTFRLDAGYHSREAALGFASTTALPQYSSIVDIPASWIVNGRIALERIKLPFGKGEIAAWAKNLTNNKDISFPENFGFLGSTEFQAARTYGLDIRISY